MTDDEPTSKPERDPATDDAPAPVGSLPDAEGELDRALALVRFLRRHCPWDADQTPRSLVPHLLEESHEVVDAIRSEDGDALEGELGDLLLNLAFQVVLGEEAGTFDAESVTDRLVEKMKRRHPHLFGLGEEEDWERMKARERTGEGVLDGLAEGLDPLLRAHRIQDRASGVGFDWAEPLGAWEKVTEEVEEVREELERVREVEGGGATEAAPDGRAPDGSETSRASGRPHSDALEEELGDLLFAVVNLVRLVGSHASTALDAANRKFSARFERLERLAADRDLDLDSASLETLDGLWEELKEGDAEAATDDKSEERDG